MPHIYFVHSCQVPADTTEAPSQPVSTVNVSEISIPIAVVVVVVAVLAAALVAVLIFMR